MKYTPVLITIIMAFASGAKIDPEPPDKNETIEEKDGKILIFNVVQFPNNPCISLTLNRVRYIGNPRIVQILGHREIILFEKLY